MSKAFKRHIGASWLPPQEYVYGVGGKKETEKLAARGKKTKVNKNPVREQKNCGSKRRDGWEGGVKCEILLVPGGGGR